LKTNVSSERNSKFFIILPILIVVLAAGVFAYTYLKPYYYVSLDVNPGITYEVNRYERILLVEAANEDAMSIVSRLDIKNLSIAEGIEQTVSVISEDGYFTDAAGSIYLATAGADNLKSSRLALALKSSLEQSNNENDIVAEVLAATVTLETVAEVKSLDITAGKYDLIKNQLKANVSDDTINASINDLVSQKSTDDVVDPSYVIQSVKAYMENDKDSFMEAISVLADALPGIEKLSYEDARTFYAYFIETHMNIDLSSLSEEDAVALVTDFMTTEQLAEAQQYKVDITGLSLLDAQLKIEAAKQELMREEATELKEKAAFYGIDITGLSKEEAWKLIKELQIQDESNGTAPDLTNPDELAAQAEKFGVDITGLSQEDAIALVKEAMNTKDAPTVGPASGTPGVESCKSYAEKIQYDLTGMSDEQIIATIEPIMRADNASYLGLDLSGMSEEEAWKVINEAQFNQLVTDLANYGVDTTGMSLEQMYTARREKQVEEEAAQAIQDKWDELRTRTITVEAELDFTGLSIEEAEALVVAAEDYYRIRKPLLEQAGQWGFDASNMTNEEVDAKIKELLQTPHDFPDEEESN